MKMATELTRFSGLPSTPSSSPLTLLPSFLKPQTHYHASPQSPYLLFPAIIYTQSSLSLSTIRPIPFSHWGPHPQSVSGMPFPFQEFSTVKIVHLLRCLAFRRKFQKVCSEALYKPYVIIRNKQSLVIVKK